MSHVIIKESSQKFELAIKLWEIQICFGGR